MPASATVVSLATGSNAFGFDLYRSIRTASGNVALSPTSITAALAMTWLGARGRTESEMRKVLHFRGPADAVTRDWGALLRGLESPSRPNTLRIANRLYGEKSYTFEPAFLEKTRAAFGAPLEPTDFASASEPARIAINGWVERRTEQKIKDLLPAGALDARSRLVLVNAIYFLAEWVDAFETQATRDEDFHTAPGIAKTIPMMHRTGEARVGQVDGVKVLEPGYKGGSTSMLVVLPERAVGLRSIEESISQARLETWSRSLKKKAASVSIPRFEISPSPAMSLGPELVKLGMPSAFDDATADFSGLADPVVNKERLKIDKVLHKTFVKVDEKGTQAAAATAVVAARTLGAPPPPPFEFRADHPFLFFVVDKPTGLVLFMGRVADPTSK